MAKGLSIKDESISFEELFEFQAIPPEERATMAKAQVLLIPSGYRDSPHAFSSGTSEFLAYCREKMPGIVDICTTDEGYVELVNATEDAAGDGSCFYSVFGCA